MRNDLLEFIQSEHGILKQKCKIVISMATTINSQIRAFQKNKANRNACYAMLCYAMLCYAKSLQSCPTLCDPIDSNPPGSPIPGILQASTLEWVAIAFSNM